MQTFHMSQGPFALRTMTTHNFVIVVQMGDAPIHDKTIIANFVLVVKCQATVVTMQPISDDIKSPRHCRQV